MKMHLLHVVLVSAMIPVAVARAGRYEKGVQHGYRFVVEAFYDGGQDCANSAIDGIETDALSDCEGYRKKKFREGCENGVEKALDDLWAHCQGPLGCTEHGASAASDVAFEYCNVKIKNVKRSAFREEPPLIEQCYDIALSECNSEVIKAVNQRIDDNKCWEDADATVLRTEHLTFNEYSVLKKDCKETIAAMIWDPDAGN
jgi:hypothetical protein